MFDFLHNFFPSSSAAVGVDFGTDRLRLAQVERHGSGHRLIAAASEEVPVGIRFDADARATFLSEQLPRLWAAGGFRGRRIILALPAALMHVQHLRLPRMDDASIRKALPWETQGKLPIETNIAVLRHLVAGDVYGDNEPKSEVIVMAAERKRVEQLLESAAKARLEVVTIHAEPQALVDCFAHVYRRQCDTTLANCIIDIGASGTRAVISINGEIRFIRNICIGGSHFDRAVAGELNLSPDDARNLRRQFAASTQGDLARRHDLIETPTDAGERRRDLASQANEMLDEEVRVGRRQSPEAGSRPNIDRLVAAKIATGAALEQTIIDMPTSDGFSDAVDRAISAPLSRLSEQLLLCRRYHEATFPELPIRRLIFVGGEARHRGLCRQIAGVLGIAAQIGDPMVRLARENGVEARGGIDLRSPQPDWAVALGLSMGPQTSEAA